MLRGAPGFATAARPGALVLAATLAVTAGCAAPAAAAPGTGYILGGVTVQDAPQSFVDLWNRGLGVTAGFGTPLLSRVELLGTFTIDRYAPEDVVGPELFGAERVDGGHASVLLLATELRVHPVSGLFPVAPYFGGGIGFLRQTFEELEVVVSGGGTELVSIDAENAFALTAGGGLRIRLARGVRLMLDGHWVIGFTGGERTRLVPLRVGLAIG